MANKKKRIKKRTLGEFKAWLEGIEDMQENDWCPNSTQWLTIRLAIGGIIEEEYEVVNLFI